MNYLMKVTLLDDYVTYTEVESIEKVKEYYKELENQGDVYKIEVYEKYSTDLFVMDGTH